jgi:hypothetical protein
MPNTSYENNKSVDGDADRDGKEEVKLKDQRYPKSQNIVVREEIYMKSDNQVSMLNKSKNNMEVQLSILG